MRSSIASALLLYLLTGCSGASIETVSLPQAPELSKASKFEDYVNSAIANNPAIQSNFYRWQHLTAQAIAAGKLPQPKLSLEWMIQDGVEAFIAGIMGELIWPKKLSLMSDIYSSEAKIQQFQLQDQILKTIYELRSVCHEYKTQNDKIKLTRQIFNISESIQNLILLEIGSGSTDSSSSKYARAQIDTHHAKLELTNMENKIASLQTRFRAVMGNANPATDLPIPVIDDAVHSVPNTSDLLPVLLQNNFQLKTLEEEIIKSQKIVEAAYYENIPDFGIWLKGDLKQNPVMINPELTLTLPLWRGKIRAQVESAIANQNRARSDYKSEHLALIVSLSEQLYLLKTLINTFHLFSSHHKPLTAQKTELSTARIQTGEYAMKDSLAMKLEELKLALESSELSLQINLLSDEISLLILNQKEN